MKIKQKITATLLSVLLLSSSLAGCATSALTNGAGGNLSGNQNDNALTENSQTVGNAEVSKETDNATPNILSELNEAGGFDVTYPTDSSELTLASGKATDYKIVSFFANSNAHARVNDFASSLKKKTAADFAVTSDTSSIGGKQIVVGYSSNLEKFVGDFAFKSFTGGAATLIGETVYISVATENALPLIFDHFLDQIKLIGEGDYVIPSDLKITADLCAISEKLPIFVASSASVETPPAFSASGTSATVTNKGTYDAGNGNYQQTYTGVLATNVTNYNNQLTTAGYILKQSNVINSNYFYTFVKGDTKVHINWLPTINRYSIIYGPKSDVPILNAPITSYQKLVTPSISQMALYNTGQSNVIQLEDGSFIVIDGGRSKGSSETANHDAEILYNFLVSKKPASHAKPKVVWIFTHAHADHINLPKYNFFPTYKDKIELEYVCMNFPNFDVLKNYLHSDGWTEGTEYSAFTNSINALLSAIETNFPGTPIHTVHSGDVLYFPGCEVEILNTHEDYYLNGFRNTNDTSISFIVKMNGRRFMVCGDTTASVNDHIYDMYGNYLKVDILQVSHHGVNAFMSLELVATNDPEICLWPVRNAILTSTRVTSSEAYTWLKATSGSSGQRERTHFSQNHTVTISIPDMTITNKQWYNGGTSTTLDGRTYLG